MSFLMQRLSQESELDMEVVAEDIRVGLRGDLRYPRCTQMAERG